MALSKEPQSKISDIQSLTKMISMNTIVPYLPDHLGMDIKVFEASEISQQFYLDTVHCVTKRKCFNIMCMFDTFGEYCGMTGKEVKQKLIEELDSNVTWYTMASAACLGMHGIPFIDWLKKLKRLRTWPNELTLYALCIMFRRNALVYNSGHIWTTLEVKPGLPVSIIQEMCETVMLYLGNNLYGTLKRKPFTRDHPIQFHLLDIQRMRLLHHDILEHKLHLEIRMDSDFELLLNEEEIEPLIQPKLKLLPDTQSPNLFDADYIPPNTCDVKPNVNTGILNTNVLGHITSQPPYLAKQIKQEIIDTAAQNVMEKHTQDCALYKFIQEWQNDTGLCIEDVKTLITADTTSRAIKTEPIESLSSNTESSLPRGNRSYT